MVRTVLTSAVLIVFLATALAKDSSAAIQLPMGSGLQFVLSDGKNPEAALIRDSSGALYGTTYNGGDQRCAMGCGTVFKLTPDGPRYRETILYAFHATPDGFNPAASLITDSTGSLYGTTVNGGANAWGTVFKLSPTKNGYVETILHSFVGDPTGVNPPGSLLEDKSGALYGTTYDHGPVIFGTVFKLTPHGSGYSYSLVHSFNGSDGAYPRGSLISDSSGALYGTAAAGGPGLGSGTVFKLTPNGNGFDFRLLYTFTGGSDGADPQGAVIADSNGALYGTTEFGGAAGKGTVFKLTPSRSGFTESVLHSFLGGADGHHPIAPLIGDDSGSLYGTTEGIVNPQDPRFGTAFKLTPSGNGYKYTVLHLFTGGVDGSTVDAPLIEDGSGSLFGTTDKGGARWLGTVYRLSPGTNGYQKTILHNF
jgi:uncharacterized repeat protein (TIGR03803 family)